MASVAFISRTVSAGLNCDFEAGESLCGWTNVGQDLWEVTQGFDGDPPDTGPSQDHTTNDTSGREQLAI